MIQIDIPSFAYSDEPVLSNISLQLESGRAYGVVGLNGAGKTTFFQLLAGFLKSEHCRVLRDGKVIPQKCISYMDTDLFFYPKLTAAEFLRVFKAGNAHYKEQELAELFGLPLDALIESYSTGMKKKLLLISQIKQDKDLYILDEPFNGLDLETNKLLELIISLLTERGKTVFVSSHILDPLVQVCHSILFLKNKQVYKSYAKEEFHLVSEELFGRYMRDLSARLPDIL